MGETGTAEAGPAIGEVVGAWIPLLLGLLIAILYANGLRIGFHFDDWHVIQSNAAIRHLANIPRFFADPDLSTASRDNRVVRPLLLTTFAINHAISGTAPWSYHVCNLLLHWLAAVLVFRIVRDHLWLGSRAIPIAAAAALLVAAHPLNTSAVDYVSARSAVLAAVCYLAAFDAAVRGRRVASVLCFVTALLTKENVCTLPIALLGYWLVAGVRPRWALVGALAVVAVGALAYRALLLPPSVLEAMHARDVTPWMYCMTGWSAYLYYLRLFLWPDRLVVDRLDYPIVHSFAAPQAWASLAVLTALGLLAWRARRRTPALTFAALWVLVTLAAESTVFPLTEPVNEHRPYLAMLGLGTAAALALWHTASALARRAQTPALSTFVCW